MMSVLRNHILHPLPGLSCNLRQALNPSMLVGRFAAVSIALSKRGGKIDATRIHAMVDENVPNSKKRLNCMTDKIVTRRIISLVRSRYVARMRAKR